MNYFEKRFSSSDLGLTSLEREALEYIWQQKESVINQSIEDVAKILHMSTATISRAAKKVGFSGFNELKFVMRQHAGFLTHKYSGSLDILSYKQFLMEQINETFDSLSDETIFAVLEALKVSDRIEIYAVGGSYSLAADTSKKLNFLGKITQARLDWDDLRQAATLMKPKDLAIMISMSGETHHIIEYAETVKKTGARIVSLIGNEQSKLQSLSDMSIVTKSRYKNYGEADLGSRVAMQAVLDYLLELFIQAK
ncbi:MurR/RpiR family transcriptional regulator [Streptococcus cameli]